MKTILVSAALAAVLATPALSADLMIPDDAPMMMQGPAVDWSGPYAGVVAGYGAGTATSHEGSVVGSYDLSGGLLGGTLGINQQFDKFVLGVEGDIAWSGLTGGAPCAVSPGTFDCAGSIEWLATLRGRAGFAVDSLLLYGTAGVAVANATATVTPAPQGATGKFSDQFIGWTAGVGAELMVSDNMSVKAEYDYIDLGTRTAPAGTLTTIDDSTLSASFSAVKLGLNIHF